jgi:hypothetical protein
MVFLIQVSASTYSQNFIQQEKKTVTGKVADASNQPVAGATVVIKGTIQGTVTNVDGNYSLANIPNDATLVFSFVGMQSQEVKIDNQTVVNVVLAEKTVGVERRWSVFPLVTVIS